MPASRNVLHALEEAAGNRPADYMRNKGWVLTTLQNAFWQLLHASSIEEGVVETVQLGGDTDTHGAIAGARSVLFTGERSCRNKWLDRV